MLTNPDLPSTIFYLRCVATAAALSAAGVFAESTTVELDPYEVESSRGANTWGAAGRSAASAIGGASINATAELVREIPGVAINDSGARGFTDTTTVRGLTSTPLFSSAVMDLRYGGFPIVGPYAGFTAQAPGVEIRRIEATSLASGTTTRPGGRIEIGFAGEEPWPNLLTVAAGTEGFLNGEASGTIDGLGATVSGFLSWAQDEGRLYNTTIDESVDERRSLHGQTRLRWSMGERSSLVLHLMGEWSKDGAQPLVPLSAPGYEVERPSEGETDLSNLLGGILFNHEADHFTLTSTTTVQRWDLDPYRNTFVLPPALVSDLSSIAVLLSQEFMFFSVPDAQTWDWSAGLIANHIDRDSDIIRSIPGFGPVEASASEMESSTLGINGAVRFNLGSDLGLTTGLKLESVRSSIDRSSAIPPGDRIDQTETDTAVLPFVRLQSADSIRFPWQVALSTGWKPGGYSGYSGSAEEVRFKPEKTVTLEGSVSSPGKNPVMVTAYGTLSMDTQVERSYSATDYLVRNADSTHIYGLELSTTRPITDDLSISVRGSYVHATFNQYIDPYTGVDYSGKTVPYVPNYGLNLSLEYQRPEGFFAGARIDLTGSTHYDETNVDAFTQGAFTTLEAWIGWRWDQAELVASGTNLTDSYHYTSIVPDIRHAVPVIPRRFNVRLTWRY